MSETINAERFIKQLQEHRSAEQQAKIQRYFKTGEGEYSAGDVFIGVPMGTVFKLARQFIDMPLDQIEALLESELHEARAGAVKIMALRSKRKKTTDEQRREVFDLYLRRHDRINNWDLVDLGAWDVVGRYLTDKPREVLYELARSANLWERRTAMLSTLHFVRQGDLDDAFTLAETLLDDDEDVIHTPIGGILREAGNHDRERLNAFLDQYAATMPRTALRSAIEHFDKDQRQHYLNVTRRTA
jgi:3-methyladenine DNA glycosylase AlkD